MNKYTVSSKVSSDWDGQTGAQVQTNIKEEFDAVASSIESIVDDSITGITAENNDGNVVITLQKGDGTTIAADFDSIVKSSYTNKFEIVSGVEQVIGLDKDPVIQYKYAVQDDLNDYVSNYTGTLRYFIGGQELTVEGGDSTGRSRNGEYTYSLTIPKEIFGDRCGKITLTIKCQTAITENSLTGVAQQVITVYRVGLNTTVRITDQEGSIIDKFPYNGSVTIPYSVLYTDGKGISTDGKFTIEPKLYQGGVNVNNVVDNSNNVYTQGDNSVTVNLSKFGVQPNSTQTPIIICLVAKKDGLEIARSNYVCVYIANSNYSGTSAQFAGILYPTAFASSTPIFEKDQYQMLRIGEDTNNDDIILKVYNNSATKKCNLKISASQGNPYEEEIDKSSSGYINYDVLCREVLNPTQTNFIVSSKLESDENYEGVIFARLKVKELASGFKQLTDYVISYNCDNANDNYKGNNIWGTGATKAIFENFDYSSSKWTTENGQHCLKITGNARVRIPYNIFSSENITGKSGYAVSIRYKMVSSERSSNPIIFSENNNNEGFYVYPRWIRMRNGGSDIYIDNNDLDVHEVTFICYSNNNSNGIWKGKQAIFVDGQIQLINNATAPAIAEGKEIFIGNSESDSTLYVYNVNIFNRSISFLEAQSLYCFNSLTGTNLSKYITNNTSILNTTSTGVRNQDAKASMYKYSYVRSITPETLPKDALYMIISSKTEEEGGSAEAPLSYDPDPWFEINKSGGTAEEIELTKKIRHAIGSIGFYQKGASNTARNFFAVEGTLSPQGTSSMWYPIKNFRIYFNQATKITYYSGQSKNLGKTTALYLKVPEPSLNSNYIPDTQSEGVVSASKKEYSLFNKTYPLEIDNTYDKPSAPADRFCLKADYAESSGSHNTGFARLTNDALKQSDKVINSAINPGENNNYKGTPPQYMSQDYNYDVRTNIDGRAIYLFFYRPKCQDIDGNILEARTYYAGRYNLNNDKANEKVFGFTGVDAYENNEIVKAEYNALTSMPEVQAAYGDAAGYRDAHESNETFVNPNECWEFSTNTNEPGLIGAFLVPDQSHVFNRVPNDAGEKVVSNWMNAWEYRFPDLEGEADEKYRKGITKPYLLQQVYKFLVENSYCLNGKTANVLDDFAANLHKFFNVDNVIKYYVLTHWFGCVDQRVKNTMLAFFCDTQNVQDPNESPMHRMRGYFIFYDNDTILGLKNDGTLDPSVEKNRYANVMGYPWDMDEDSGLFALSNAGDGKSATLWDNIYQCHKIYLANNNPTSNAHKLGSLVHDAYVSLRNYITFDKFNKYFNTYQVKYYPDSVQNVDTEIKYLYPKALWGQEDNAEAEYLDKDHGTRYLHRDLWFKNRTRLLDHINDTGNDKDYFIQIKALKGAGTGTTVFGEWSWTVDKKFSNVDWRLKMFNQDSGSSNAVVSEKGATSMTYPVYDGNSFCVITGLYALDSISILNKQFGDFSIGGSNGAVFENLKKIELSGDWQVPFQSLGIKSTNIPNLQTLSLIMNNGSAGNVDLRGFSKLEVVDFGNSAIGVFNAPYTAKEIYATNVSELYLEGCNNIAQESKLDVNYSSILKVSNSSATVYKKILNLVQSKGDAIGSVNIEFSKVNNGYYEPESSEFSIIYNLAEQAQSSSFNLTFSGTILKLNATAAEQDKIESLRSWYGEDFVKTFEDTTEATIICSSSNNTLYEDGVWYGVAGQNVTVAQTTSTVLNNVDLNNNAEDLITFSASGFSATEWSVVKVNGDINLEDIYFAYVSAKTCKLYLRPSSENNSQSGIFKIIAKHTSGQLEYQFTCSRIAVNAFDIVNQNGDPVDRTFHSLNMKAIIRVKGQHTKKSLLNSSSYINIFDINIEPSTYTTGTITYDSDAGGVSIPLPDPQEDISITVQIKNNPSTSQKVVIFLDGKIGINLDSIDENGIYAWLKVLIDKVNMNTRRDVLKSDCYRLTGLSNHLSGMTLGTTTVQDMTLLRYFNASGGTSITISSSLKFSSIETPENCQYIAISIPGGTESGVNIKLRESVQRAKITGSFDDTQNTIPSDIHVDLSENNTINKITANDGNASTKGNLVFRINLIKATDGKPNQVSSKGIFALNSSVKYEVGDAINGDDVINDEFVNGQANLMSYSLAELTPIYSTQDYSSPALFKLFRNHVAEVSIHGNICKYKVSINDGDSYLKGDDFANISKLEATFARGSGFLQSNTGIELTKLTEIGDYSFAYSGSMKNNVLQLNTTQFDQSVQELDTYSILFNPNNIESIGKFAFYYCHQIVRPIEYTETNGQVPLTNCFNKLKRIGRYAFSNSIRNMTMYIKVPDESWLNIDDNAFYNCYSYSTNSGKTGQTLVWDIYIITEGSGAVNVKDTAFQTDSGNVINIYTNNEGLKAVATAAHNRNNNITVTQITI